MYRKRDKDLENGIVCGIPLSLALQMVVLSCNKPDTLYIAERRLKSQLQRLRRLLSDPLTSEHAEILRGIVLKEKPIDDVIEWLRHSPGIAWTEFVQNKAEVAQAQKRAEEKVCHQKLFEEHVKFVEELKTRDRSACPRCHSKDDVIPILYGLPKPHLLLFPEHDQYVLGGCVIFPNSDRWHCRKCDESF
jgi:hypothetical protein